MSKTLGVLTDITKCIGCGSCVVACKMWNDLKYDKKKPAAYLEEPKLTDNNWTTVSFKKVNKDGQQVLRFVKKQCLHCIEPACDSVCFSKSFKIADGAVVYNPSLCVGCRYCMLACPFEVPKYEWNKVLPSVTKCQLCYSKIANGESPACTAVCPTDALTFGEREDLLQKAKDTIANDSSYVNHIYGEKEAGGTNWLYISDVPFDELGLSTKVTNKPLPHYTHEFTKWVPHMFIGGGALFSALSFYTKRRNKVQEENKGQK